MFSIFKSNKTTVVSDVPYRPSWEKSALQWKNNHIAHKKAFESLKKELGSNTLPRI